MDIQKKIELIAQEEAAQFQSYPIDSAHEDEDIAYCRELARQRATELAAYQRTGWKAADYTALNSAVWNAVFEKLTHESNKVE